MSEIYMGVRLNKLRKRRGLSLEEVALGVGVTTSHISQLENGKRQPSFKLLSQLSQFFNVNPIFFIDSGYKYFDHGQKMKEFRLERGMSLEEVALKTGIQLTYLSEVEAGNILLNQEELEKVAEAIGIEAFDFHEAVNRYLNTIREICEVIFDLEIDEVEEVINFIRTRIRS